MRSDRDCSLCIFAQKVSCFTLYAVAIHLPSQHIRSKNSGSIAFPTMNYAWTLMTSLGCCCCGLVLFNLLCRETLNFWWKTVCCRWKSFFFFAVLCFSFVHSLNNDSFCGVWKSIQKNDYFSHEAWIDVILIGLNLFCQQLMRKLNYAVKLIWLVALNVIARDTWPKQERDSVMKQLLSFVLNEQATKYA